MSKRSRPVVNGQKPQRAPTAAELQENLTNLVGLINADPGPITVTVAVSQLNGRMSVSLSNNYKNPIEDLGRMSEALDQARRLIDEERLKISSKAAAPTTGPGETVPVAVPEEVVGGSE